MRNVAVFVRNLLVCAASFASVGTSALTYPSGTIQSLYISGENNFAVRVVLNGVTNPCGNGVTGWAYMNATYTNYKVYVAGLMLAKAQGSNVNLVVAPDANGYCQLIEFAIN
jgi:hypothetical protein